MSNSSNKSWDERHRPYRRYLSLRSSAKTFINKYAQAEDLEVLEKLIIKAKERGSDK